MRSFFYFDRYQYGDPESEAWALGGAVSYRSGWLADRIGTGATLYTSQPAHAPEDRDGTSLLKPGQDGYWVVGELYGRVKLDEDDFLNLYRYGGYTTPFIGRNDSRMSPNTFEGYTLTGALDGGEGAPSLRYGGGYINKIKERNSDHFVWMSTAAGAKVKRGVVLGGGLLSYGRFSIGAVDYYSQDIINIGYGEAVCVFHPTEAVGLLFSLQFTDQRSVGDERLKDAYFSTRQLGVKSEASYAGTVLTLGYTVDSAGDDLQSPWSGYPGYTGVQVQDFNRAREEAFLVKGSYDLSRLGLGGWSVYALYVRGWAREDPQTGARVADEQELDADLQWRPKLESLKGLSLRTRYALVHQYQGAGDYIHDLRVIVSYEFSLL